jgi:hypothetical protein
MQWVTCILLTGQTESLCSGLPASYSQDKPRAYAVGYLHPTHRTKREPPSARRIVHKIHSRNKTRTSCVRRIAHTTHGSKRENHPNKKLLASKTSTNLLSVIVGNQTRTAVIKQEISTYGLNRKTKNFTLSPRI